MPDGAQTPLAPGWINQWIPGWPFLFRRIHHARDRLWQGPPPWPWRNRLWPVTERPQVMVDAWRVMLADPDGNLIGLPDPYEGPQRRAQTQRTIGTREF